MRERGFNDLGGHDHVDDARYPGAGKHTLTESLARSGALPADLERPIQRRESRDASYRDDLHYDLSGASGSGESLPEATRSHMERSFQTDFSDVRVHQGPQAASVGAMAYAQGSDLHFAPGAYDPSSPSGMELLGHELTHVVQQRAGVVSTPQGKGGGAAINADPGLEAEADRVGARAARGELVSVSGAAQGVQPKMAPGAVIQCGNKNGGEEKKARSNSLSEPEGPDEAEKAKAIFDAFNRLKPLALALILTQPRYDFLKNWSEKQREAEYMRAAMELAVFDEIAKAEIGRLVLNDYCSDPAAARDALLAECDRLYPGQKPKEATEEEEEDEPASLKDFVYCGRQTWCGKAGLVAAILSEEKCMSYMNDYGDRLIGWTVEAMKSEPVPGGTPQAIIKGKSTFKDKCVANFYRLVQESDGAKGKGTQMGNTDASYGEWKSK